MRVFSEYSLLLISFPTLCQIESPGSLLVGRVPMEELSQWEGTAPQGNLP